MTHWTNRLLIVLTLLVAVSIGLELSILSRLVPGPLTGQAGSHAASPPAGKVHPGIGRDVEVSGLPSQGEQNAPIAIIEFSDYECPFCAMHAEKELATLRSQFVSTGIVQYFFANLPLVGHENARFLATAAICAGDEKQYWPMHDELFREKPKTRNAVLGIALRLNLDRNRFSSCLDKTESLVDVERDLREANQLGVGATPTFLIGPISNSTVNVRAVLEGAQPLTAFEAAITGMTATPLALNSK